MSDGPTFQQTTNGGSPQVNQGVTINDPTNITNNDSGSRTAEIFEPILEAVKDSEWSSDTPEPVKLKFANPTAMVESAQKAADAELTAASDMKPDVFEQRKKSWSDWLQWIGQGALKVGLTIADKQAEKSATLAGLKTAMEFVQSAMEPAEEPKGAPVNPNPTPSNNPHERKD